jgi:cobaltochelatase CobN
MLAIFMVAAEKGFWQADDATLKQMGGELARLVAKNGLPGSGHTAPHHPMWNWLQPRIDAVDANALGVALARARGEGLAPAPIAPITAMAATPRQQGARHEATTPRREQAAVAPTVPNPAAAERSGTGRAPVRTPYPPGAARRPAHPARGPAHRRPAALPRRPRLEPPPPFNLHPRLISP